MIAMKVSVIGLGYVGSVAAAGLAAAGHEVLGIDVNRERVNAYSAGSVPIYEPGLEDLIAQALHRNLLRFRHPEDVSEDLGQVVLIATGTPPIPNGAADLSQVRSAITWVRDRQDDGGVIVVKSTVPSGTGARIRETLLKGASWSYVSNPEFLREGQAMWDWFHPDRIVIGGDDPDAIELVKDLYRGVEAPFVVTDVTSAEMIKYAANAFLATKISFINEIAMLCDRINASIDDVVQGIALDPRIGGSFLRAGVGYGGSCFPKDVDSLDHTALTNGHSFELLRSVIAVNNRQRLLPLHAMRETFGSLLGVRVGVVGLAFKPHTDDVRESPAIELVRILAEEGAIVKAYDPKANQMARRVIPASVNLVDCPLECAQGAQALVLMTEWPEIVGADWEEMARRSQQPRLLFDGRNALDAAQMQDLGFRYRGVGRGVKAPIKKGDMVKA
jgi:UDPglucose 6-dehydrogenase